MTLTCLPLFNVILKAHREKSVMYSGFGREVSGFQTEIFSGKQFGRIDFELSNRVDLYIKVSNEESEFMNSHVLQQTFWVARKDFR
jgi:hypothetical protein